jgi:integral membrane protein
MRDFLYTPLGLMRIIAFLEGVSFLLLLGVAMPLKYMAGQPEWVRVVGMAHGILFLVYIPSVFYVMDRENWSPLKTSQALLASVIPFGTFWADVRLFRGSR